MIHADNYSEDAFKALGKRCDVLFEKFNSGLHHSPSRSKIERALLELGKWTSDVVTIHPATARRPYLAYGGELAKFLEEVAEGNAQSWPDTSQLEAQIT